MPRKTDVLVIGGGQAGLATSRCLSDLGIEHVVLERGRVAQRWQTERWTSLHLLTPNWMTRLPGFAYQGKDPNGFMHKDEVARFLTDYSHRISAPVVPNTQVVSVRHQGERFQIHTNTGSWIARSVVVATGACDRPNVPSFARSIAPHIQQVTLDQYKCPQQIGPGGVLVVGASASGLQIASELQGSGRKVTLAAGQHTRIPRRYRGKDIMAWLDQSGLLSHPRDAKADADKCAAQHSFQLIGGPNAQSLDLMKFQSLGGTVTGRLAAAEETRIRFADTLPTDIARAEARQAKILNDIDGHIARAGLSAEPAEKIVPVTLPPSRLEMDLDQAGVTTIIWATGYRRDYAWLDIPVLSPRREILQWDGLTPLAGLFTMGLPGMRRRNSSFIDGVGDDARFIAQQIALHLGHSVPLAA